MFGVQSWFMKQFTPSTLDILQETVSPLFPIMVAVLITSVIAVLFYVKKRQSGF